MFADEVIESAEEAIPGIGLILRAQNLCEARKVEHLSKLNTEGLNEEEAGQFYELFGFESPAAPMRLSHLFTAAIVAQVVNQIASGAEVDAKAAMAGIWADGFLCGLALAELREKEVRDGTDSSGDLEADADD